MQVSVDSIACISKDGRKQGVWRFKWKLLKLAMLIWLEIP
jgi:hypothetical protein